VICIAEFLSQQLQTRLTAGSSTSVHGAAVSSTGDPFSLNGVNADLVKNVTPQLVKQKRIDLRNLIKALRGGCCD
jgi:hypothetical protein